MEENMMNACVLISTKQRFKSGNKTGEWIYLKNFSSKEEFMKSIKEKFLEENHPKPLFLEWTDLPDIYISKEDVSGDIFKLINFIKGLNEYQYHALKIWLKKYPLSIMFLNPETIQKRFTQSYYGYFNNKITFGRYLAKEELNIRYRTNPNFDFKSYTKNLFSDRFFIVDGYVFEKMEDNNDITL